MPVPELFSRRLSPAPALLTGCALALLLLGPPSPAEAALGAPLSLAEVSELGYSQATTSSLPGGLTAITMTRTRQNPLNGRPVPEVLRQVAGPSGRIFALSWKGLGQPDLSKLLPGRIPAAVPYRRGSTLVTTPTLVLHLSGSVLFSEGAAWDPALVPPGVAPLTVLSLP